MGSDIICSYISRQRYFTGASGYILWVAIVLDGQNVIVVVGSLSCVAIVLSRQTVMVVVSSISYVAFELEWQTIMLVVCTYIVCSYSTRGSDRNGGENIIFIYSTVTRWTVCDGGGGE